VVIGLLVAEVHPAGKDQYPHRHPQHDVVLRIVEVVHKEPHGEERRFPSAGRNDGLVVLAQNT